MAPVRPSSKVAANALGTSATRPAKIMRGTGKQAFECTGEKGPSYEDNLDWCLGWVKTSDPNCTKKPEYEFDPTQELSTGRMAGRKGPDPEDFEIQGVRDASRGGRAGIIHDYSDGELKQILERLRARVEKLRSAGQADTEILEETIYQIERALRLRDLGMSKRVL